MTGDIVYEAVPLSIKFPRKYNYTLCVYLEQEF